MKDHYLMWSNNKAIFNVIGDNTVWKHKVNILSVNFKSDYIIYCPFQMQKQFFLHSLAIWHENVRSDRKKKLPDLNWVQIWLKMTRSNHQVWE